jgi:hypothetical protein
MSKHKNNNNFIIYFNIFLIIFFFMFLIFSITNKLKRMNNIEKQLNL